MSMSTSRVLDFTGLSSHLSVQRYVMRPISVDPAQPQHDHQGPSENMEGGR